MFASFNLFKVSMLRDMLTASAADSKKDEAVNSKWACSRKNSIEHRFLIIFRQNALQNLQFWLKIAIIFLTKKIVSGHCKSEHENAVALIDEATINLDKLKKN